MWREPRVANSSGNTIELYLTTNGKLPGRAGPPGGEVGQGGLRKRYSSYGGPRVRILVPFKAAIG